MSEPFPAVMTSLIGNGERGLLFSRPLRGGGVEIFEGVIQDEHGLMSLQRGEAPRGVYRERLKQLSKLSNRVLMVPFERVREELSRAVSLNSFATIPLSLDAQAMLQKLGVEANATALPIEAPLASDAPLLPQAAALHDEPEIVSWLPPDTLLTTLSAHLEKEATASVERKQAIAIELSRAFSTKAVRAVYANRLWRMAEFFEGTDRTSQAAIARAEARSLRHTDAPSRFLEQLFVKVPVAAARQP